MCGPGASMVGYIKQASCAQDSSSAKEKARTKSIYSPSATKIYNTHFSDYHVQKDTLRSVPNVFTSEDFHTPASLFAPAPWASSGWWWSSPVQ